jgi:hypothetical protein
MGDAVTAKWHIVIKLINGRQYRYRQKSWTENGRTRTRSVYLEPADGYVFSRKVKKPTGPTSRKQPPGNVLRPLLKSVT